MCDKAFNKSFIAFFIFLIDAKLKKCVRELFLMTLFSIRYVPDKTQQMCDKAVDDCLVVLEFVPDWFATSKMIKILFTGLYADENFFYFNEDFDNAIVNCNEIGYS